MGVAGAGMVSLAELLLRNGWAVSGCDLEAGLGARALESLGATVIQGHDPSHVEGASALVFSAAIPLDHPEIARARELGIPILKRAEALGQWVNQGRVLAVAGTHGKTTTTAMATEILAAAGLDPTGLVGGRVRSWGSNLRPGTNELFVVEADEFDRSFHHLRPDIAVVTNLEADHLDIFGDLDGVRDAFHVFLDLVPEDGRVVVCGDDHGASRLLPRLGGKAVTYGLNPGAMTRGTRVVEDAAATTFEVTHRGEPSGEIRLAVPGRHNVLNALAAATAARLLEVGWDAIRAGLEGFQGVGRRFQLLGEAEGIMVVDDYAHHPTEIEATLSAARGRFPDRRLVAVFQPHLFSRTRDQAQQLGMALSRADEVWVTEIYPAREEPIEGVTGVMVAQAALDAGAEHVFFHPELADLPAELAGTLRPGDVCLTLGAGSVEVLGGDLLMALGKRRDEEEV
jgi:UDP-N-acetylmuramate--alanine ligase